MRREAARSRLKAQCHLLWLSDRFCKNCGAADPGCGRLSAGICRIRRLENGPKEPPKRRLRARLRAPQLTQTATIGKVSDIGLNAGSSQDWLPRSWHGSFTARRSPWGDRLWRQAAGLLRIAASRTVEKTAASDTKASLASRELHRLKSVLRESRGPFSSFPTLRPKAHFTGMAK